MLKSPEQVEKPDEPTSNANKGRDGRREHKKTIRQYKAAISINKRLANIAEGDLTKQDLNDLAFAKEALKKGREYCSTLDGFEATDQGFANIIEENEAKKPVPKRQRSLESESPNENVAKKGRTSQKTSSWSDQTLVSKVLQNHLIVYLIDLNHPYGHITNDQWLLVQNAMTHKLIGLLDSTESHLPSFDSFGWHKGVKTLKCYDEMSLKWCKENVPQLQDLWPGARLIIGTKDDIPYVPNGKTTFPVKVPPEETLRLLQRQNPEIPTHDWKISKVIPSKDDTKGQTLIIQINTAAEDLLYSRMGKLRWGFSNVFMKLKKRKNNIQNDNTVEEDEIERDLGLEVLMAETENLNINADNLLIAAEKESLSTKHVEVSSDKSTSQ